jgi:hypothetical protein
MEERKSSRFSIPLSVYLNKIKSDHTRQAIAKKLRRIMSLSTEETKGSTIDAFRLLGKATLQVQLITELNTFIMGHITSYMMTTPWAKELWEYREHYVQLVKLSNDMCRALIFKGHLDGLYTEGQDEQTQEAL